MAKNMKRTAPVKTYTLPASLVEKLRPLIAEDALAAMGFDGNSDLYDNRPLFTLDDAVTFFRIVDGADRLTVRDEAA